MRLITLLFSLLLLSGCTTIQKEYVAYPLYHKPRPIYPRVTAIDLECLSKDVYQKLFDRHMALVEYATELETTIDSTRETKNEHRN